MEGRAQTIQSYKNKKIKIKVIPGHFATNHSHINYYADLTSVRTSYKMAKEAAVELAGTYANTNVDTIICLEGTEMLGAFLAQSLSDGGINRGADISVVTPELNSNGQMLFRDNTQKKIWGKQVLLLISSVSTGKTIKRALECLQYYSGNLAAIAAIFSAVDNVRDIDIHAIFTRRDIPNYDTYATNACPMCKNGQKVDALVNGFGYSKI